MDPQAAALPLSDEEAIAAEAAAAAVAPVVVTAASSVPQPQQRQHVRPRVKTAAPRHPPSSTRASDTTRSAAAASPSPPQPGDGAPVIDSSSKKGILKSTFKYTSSSSSTSSTQAERRTATAGPPGETGGRNSNVEGALEEQPPPQEHELVIVERRRPRKNSSNKPPMTTTTTTNTKGRTASHDDSDRTRFASSGNVDDSSKPTDVNSGSGVGRLVSSSTVTTGMTTTASSSISAAAASATQDASIDIDDDDEDPLVFQSLYEMMEHAGTLPEESDSSRPGSGPDRSRRSDGSGGNLADLAPGSVVEADLEFQCMDPGTWEQEQRQQQQQQRPGGTGVDVEPELVEEPRWLTALPYKERSGTADEGDDATTASGDTSNDHDSDEEDEDDDYVEFLQSLKDDRRNSDDYYSSDDDDPFDDADADEAGSVGDHDDIDGHVDDSERVHRLSHETGRPSNRSSSSTGTADAGVADRPFLTLWRALTQWVTPQAARYLRSTVPEGSLRPFEPVLDADCDIVASRFGGLYAQIQMHVPSCLSSLRYVDNPRLAWIRLGDLLRCFSYDRPMPDLDRRHLRALTVVLLHSVLRNQDGFGGDDMAMTAPPEPCVDLGLTLAEYRHLTRVLMNLGGDDECDVVVEDPYGVNTGDGPVDVPRPKNGFHSGEN